MNSTDILLHVPVAGRMTIRAKMILWEMLGRHTIEDFDQFSCLPAALRKPFRRLCILLLGKEVKSAGQHDGMMRLAERIALTGYASKMEAGLAAVELGFLDRHRHLFPGAGGTARKSRLCLCRGHLQGFDDAFV